MEEKVTLYSTNCPKCIILEKKMKQNGIIFEKNMDVDKMIEMGIMQAPVLKVGDELLNFKQAVQWVNLKKHSDELGIDI